MNSCPARTSGTGANGPFWQVAHFLWLQLDVPEMVGFLVPSAPFLQPMERTGFPDPDEAERPQNGPEVSLADDEYCRCHIVFTQSVEFFLSIRPPTAQLISKFAEI